MTTLPTTWTVLSRTARAIATPTAIDAMFRELAGTLDTACAVACDAHNRAVDDGSTVTYVIDPATVTTHCTPLGSQDVLLTVTGTAVITTIPADLAALTAAH